MTLSTAELLRALPDDLERELVPENTIEDLMQRLARRPVPTGRLRRMWTLGTLQGKIAAAYLAWWLRTLPSASGEKQRKLDETHLKTALRTLGTMSYLRGAVMKAGQVLANYPDVVPMQFANLLGRLHFDAPPMHFSLLREVFRRELGREPDEVFDDFETNAFAAASLGQVHRARLKGSGLTVAVKIQYPGIAETIRQDMRNLRAAALPMRLSRDWDNLMDQFDEIRHMLELESDYEKEAENQRLARSAFTDADNIIVPRVIDEFSTKRVLTSEFIDGVHLPQFLQTNPSQSLRDHFGELITLTSFRLSYRVHLLYADPHPGNFLFRDDRRLGLIDFGCCHRYNDEDIDYMTEVEKAALGSPEELRRALCRAAMLDPDDRSHDERLKLLRAWCEWLWKPLFHEAPFDFSDGAYFAEGVELFGEVIKRRYLRSKPVNTWLNKDFLGLRAMLTHLKARVNMNAIALQETTVTRLE